MIRKHIFANGEDVADVQGERHNHQGIASGGEPRSEHLHRVQLRALWREVGGPLTPPLCA
jgi:hypothetical protein